MLLDRGPPADLLEAQKGWLEDVLAKARDYPQHMEVLLQRGYLIKPIDGRILQNMLAGAFEAGNLAFVRRLLKHGGIGLLDALDGSDTEYMNKLHCTLRRITAPRQPSKNSCLHKN